METLTIGAAIAYFVNTFSPLLIQWLQSVRWPVAVKSIVAMAAAGVVGVGSAYVAGVLTSLPLDWSGYVVDAAITMPYVLAMYDKIYHPTGLASAKLGIDKPAIATYTQADLDAAVAAALARAASQPSTPPSTS